MTITRSPASHYRDALLSSETEDVMRRGNIIPNDGTPAQLLELVNQRLAGRDSVWASPHQAVAFADDFMADMQAGRLTLGSPALTNMWQADRPFASCAAVPSTTDVDLGPDEQERLAEDFYLQNMGSGFNLDAYADPVRKLLHLNEHAELVQSSGACERYVGNMAHVSASHPRVRQFIDCKVDRRVPHFNISINWSEAELQRLEGGDPDLADLVFSMAEAAWECGDPGLISLDRFNARNPLASTSPYVTTAPCAEVGLAPGDTCLFAYINVAAFATSTTQGEIDYAGIARTVGLAVRGLDDLLEADVDHLHNPLSRSLAWAKRRIGIGLCGFADLLLWQGIKYASATSLEILEDILSVIQLAAVEASCALAEERGAFPSFELSDWRTGRPTPPATARVSADAWSEAYQRASTRGIRHSVTTALPPSGRAAILLRANTSIEPFLTDPRQTALTAGLRRHAATLDDVLTRTATAVSWTEHLDVLSRAVEFLDESASKTVNLAPTSTSRDIFDIFVRSAGMGLRAISVYRATIAS